MQKSLTIHRERVMFALSVAFRDEPSLPIRHDQIVNETSPGMRILESLVLEMERVGFTRHQIGHVQVAFSEALVNAVRHGNRNDPLKAVRIQYRIDSEGLWLSVEDEGHGFQLEEVADPRLPENLDRPGGRGLLLMKSLMSHVEFNARGNHVVMRLLKSAA